MEEEITKENVPKRGMGLAGVILIIIIALIVLAGIAVAAIYLYNSKYKNHGSEEAAKNTTNTPVLEDESTWTVYTRAGDYSIKMPPILIRPGNQTDLEEVASFSRSGDTGADEFGNQPTMDPDLFSTIWATPNTENLIAKQAVEEEKNNIMTYPISSFQVIEEKATTLDNNPAYQGVWSYSELNTGFYNIYAVACSVKNNKVYYVSFVITSLTQAGALQAWQDYSYIFGKMISVFIFI